MSLHRRGKAKPCRRFIKESMHSSIKGGSSVPPATTFTEKFRHEIQLKPSTDLPQKIRHEIQ